MSKTKNAITEIKKLMVQFGFMTNEESLGNEIETVKESFVDAVLEDGTKIKIEGDAVVEGAKVVVVTEEGELQAPDGVHTVSDGSKVETKDGIIVAITAAQAMEDGAEKEEEAIDEEKKEEVDEEMYAMLKDMLIKISDKMKKMENKMGEVEKEFNAFKKAPASKPIPSGKTDFSSTVTDYEDARVKAILQLRNNK
jgi:propanediol utilization protein